MSLSIKDIVVFQPPPGTTSIGLENALHKQWQKDHPDMKSDHKAYEKWRKEELQKYTEYSGFKIPGMDYKK
jgi:hypothetical protein